MATTCARVEELDDPAAPFEDEPGFYEASSLWLYGNVRLLTANLFHIGSIAGGRHFSRQELDLIESETEEQVLQGKILVCGVHNEAHMRSSVVPLRWGSPRIAVFSGGFRHHLGKDLSQEPLRVCRLWRYQWDPITDLAVSLRAPDKKPTYAFCNPTVDRLIHQIANRERVGLDSLMASLDASRWVF